jgi:2-oxoisovalerate dehydrogenase E2 component (dihydrolipoyl transacylase)
MSDAPVPQIANGAPANPDPLRPGVWAPLSPVRRAIAEHMVRSVTTAPHVSFCVDVDVTGLVRARQAMREAFRAREGFDLSYVPFVARVVVDALREHPIMNAAYQSGPRGEPGAIVAPSVGLGIAVAIPDGLIVPVIPNAENLGIVGLARAIDDLVGRARQGRLKPHEARGGTFTLNNTGAFGSVRSSPIINDGQAGIMTMEVISRRPVVLSHKGEESIAIRSIMSCCLSFDHRVVDGEPAGRFMQSVRRGLESIDRETVLA